MSHCNCGTSKTHTHTHTHTTHADGQEKRHHHHFLTGGVAYSVGEGIAALSSRPRGRHIPEKRNLAAGMKDCPSCSRLICPHTANTNPRPRKGRNCQHRWGGNSPR